MKPIRTLSACVLLVATLTSCVAPAKQSDGKDANGKQIKYVYYTPIGSNVPIRVPADQVPGGGDESATPNKTLSDMERNGSAGTPMSPGGK